MRDRKKNHGEIFLVPGDLVAVPDGRGWIVAQFISGTLVSWGDVVKRIDPPSCLGIRRTHYMPSTGVLCGRRFNSRDELITAVQPHKKVKS